MKRSALLVVIVILMLFGMLECFCAADESIGILSDLALLDQLESQQLKESIQQYSKELEYKYRESVRITKLMKDYGKPSSVKTQQVMANEILYVLGYKNRGIDDNSLLFRDDIFIDYYRLRTTKVLEEYKKSREMDFSLFIGRSKKEFDKYLSDIQKDGSKKDRITLLLQDKLTDKMYSDDMDKKSDYFDQVLALRLASSSDKRNQGIYELMESRVRLKLLEELADINKAALTAYLDEAKVLINNDTSGVLTFRYISDIEKRTVLDYSVYMAAGNSDYKLVQPLGRLAAIYGKATFTSKNGDVKVMSRDSIWGRMRMGAAGLEVSLTEAYIKESELPAYDVFSIIPDNIEATDMNGLLERGESLGNGSKEAERLAQEITKSLCALDSYSELRAKGISNAYTAKFEVAKGTWLADLNANLNRMNKLAAVQKGLDTGYLGFLSYIRQYVDYSRECAAAGMPESSSVMLFRDTVLQFRQVDEGALWILDMLYKLKYLQ